MLWYVEFWCVGSWLRTYIAQHQRTLILNCCFGAERSNADTSNGTSSSPASSSSLTQPASQPSWIPCGCIALRKLSNDNFELFGEIKRLFVLPEYRYLLDRMITMLQAHVCLFRAVLRLLCVSGAHQYSHLS